MSDKVQCEHALLRKREEKEEGITNKGNNTLGGLEANTLQCMYYKM